MSGGRAIQTVSFSLFRDPLDTFLTALANEIEREFPKRFSAVRGLQPFLLILIAITRNTYDALRFLVADIPKDSRPKAEYGPPTADKLPLDDKQVEATGEKYMNRLRYFIVMHSSSDARTVRLRNAIVGLNTRLAAAVHADVSSEEARALFVLLYVTLGENLSLKPA